MASEDEAPFSQYHNQSYSAERGISPLPFKGATRARITKPPRTTIKIPIELTSKASVE